MRVCAGAADKLKFTLLYHIGAVRTLAGPAMEHAMSSFMFAIGGGDLCMWAQPGPDDPEEILRRMRVCLEDLDRIGASLPAIHLATAIEYLRAQYGLPDISSELD